MGMSSDVKATTLTATGDVFAGPARVKAIHIIAGATAGSVVVKDGGSGGTTVLDLKTPASATAQEYIRLPGNGIRCASSCHVTVTNAASVTVFYA